MKQPYEEVEIPSNEPSKEEVEGSDLDMELVCELSKQALDDFRAAVLNRKQEMIGNQSVQRILEECDRQYDGIYSNGELEDAYLKEQIQRSGMVYVNLTKLKVDALAAWITDLVNTTADAPWTVKPTPIPDIDEDSLSEISKQFSETLKNIASVEAEQVVQAIVDSMGVEQGTPEFELAFEDLINNPEMLEKIRSQAEQAAEQTRLEAMDNINEIAKSRALNMETLMRDQSIEGKFKEVYANVRKDFVMYPYCVMEGPIVKNVMTFEYDSDRKLKKKYTEQIQAVRIHPKNFYWTADCTSSQDGTAVFIVSYISKAALYEMLSCDPESYIKENVQKVIYGFEQGHARDWLISMEGVEGSETSAHIDPWNDHEKIPVVKRYGKIQGKLLKEYIKDQDFEDNVFYETQIVLVNRLAVRVILNPSTDPNVRPVHTASYVAIPDKIAGVSIPQMAKDAERLYINTIRNVVINSAYASRPFISVDSDRIDITNDKGDGEALYVNPGEMFTASGDDGMRSLGPAFEIHNTPFVSAALINVAERYMALVDKLTQIPAAIHGEPIGTGVNRTFQGATMLYGNALKPVQDALNRFDTGIISPYATSLYEYNMLYSDDESVKGDSNVQARGASGLLEKELQRQDRMEILQLVMNVAQTGNIPQPIVTEVVKDALESIGFNLQKYAGMFDQVPPVVAQEQQPTEAPMPTGDLTDTGMDENTAI